MTLQLEIMPAHNPSDSTSTTGTHGEGVKALAIFDSRWGRDKAAWAAVSLAVPIWQADPVQVPMLMPMAEALAEASAVRVAVTVPPKVAAKG